MLDILIQFFKVLALLLSKVFIFEQDARGNSGWVPCGIENAFAVSGDVVAHDLLEHCTDVHSLFGELHAFGAYGVVRGFGSEGPECLYYDLVTLVEDVLKGSAILAPSPALQFKPLSVRFTGEKTLMHYAARQLAESIRDSLGAIDISWNHELLTAVEIERLRKVKSVLTASAVFGHLCYGFQVALSLYGNMPKRHRQQLFSHTEQVADRALRAVENSGQYGARLYLQADLNTLKVTGVIG